MGGHVYPEAPTRPLAQELVRKADAGLAGDYDEAVRCEPHSQQAAAFLLGRCVERVLIAHAGAQHKGTLGPKIDKAIKDKKIPDDIAPYLGEVLKHVRNQASHIWVDAQGKELRIDADDVRMAFEVVDMLLDRFYIMPAKRDAHIAKVQQVLSNKKAGEQKK